MQTRLDLEVLVTPSTRLTGKDNYAFRDADGWYALFVARIVEGQDAAREPQYVTFLRASNPGEAVSFLELGVQGVLRDGDTVCVKRIRYRAEVDMNAIPWFR